MQAERNAYTSSITLMIEPRAAEKMRLYIELADEEISGVGRANIEQGGIVKMTDAFIWDQVCGPTNTEVVDHDALFKRIEELTGQGIPASELCVWWHSHVEMEAYFSPTDNETVRGWLNNSLAVGIVGNKRGDYRASCAINTFGKTFLPDIPVLFTYHETPGLKNEIKKEITERVISAPLPPLPTYSSRQPLLPPDAGRTDPYSLYPETDEIDSAESCGCQDCADYLYGRGEFAYDKHGWNKKKHRYYRKGQYKRVLPRVSQGKKYA